MMRRLFVLMACLLVTLAVAIAEDEKVTVYLDAKDTESIMAKEGDTVVVYGQVEGAQKVPSGANFVKFKDSDFFVVTFKSDLEHFPEGEPTDVFEGKRLAVEGIIALYQKSPQMKLAHPSQVIVLGEDETFPPVVAAVADATEQTTDEPEPVEEKAKPEETPKRQPPVDPSLYFK